MLPQGWLNEDPSTVPANPNPQPPALGDRPLGQLPKWYDLPAGSLRRSRRRKCSSSYASYMEV
jgi:hypothetical protein